MAVVKLLLLLAVIVLGIRKKLFVGYLLAGVGLVTPLLYGVRPLVVVQGVWGTFSAVSFWRLFGAIVIVTYLGQLLREIGALDRLTRAAEHLAGGKRTASAILPAIIGLMPMPGGALLSAPLVGQVLEEDHKSAQFLSAVNYWFRHIMEFFWPLYPGIILGAGIAGLKIRTFSLMGIPMSVTMILLGVFFFLRKIANGRSDTHSLTSLGKIFLSIWPVILAVVLAMVFALDIVLALVISLVVAIALNRSAWPAILPVFRRSVTVHLFFMVFGILLFKDMLDLSGAVSAIPAEVNRLGIPPALVIFTVAFLSGLLTGMVAAFVGLSFPLLAGFLYQPHLHLGNIFFTYLSGYLGMILSPTHFCLLLTTEHFKADLGQVYRTFLVPLLLLSLVGISLYLSGYPWHLLP